MSVFYLLYDMDLYHKKQVENNKTRLSDETGFFSQSERALVCIYVIYSDKTGFFSQSERALDCIYIIKRDITHALICTHCDCVISAHFDFVFFF
jgi:hypothetical protein